jgi:hypothetical protein
MLKSLSRIALQGDRIAVRAAAGCAPVHKKWTDTLRVGPEL